MKFTIPLRPRLLGLGIVLLVIGAAIPADQGLKGVVLGLAIVMCLVALMQEIQLYRQR